jgi:phosphopantothenoylcysteine decarboxylase/phosphopantothenate--cysteine ligase
MLENKKILLGVCGSIAAYKAAMLVRLLVKKKAQVKVIMTPDAKSFITPLTLSTLSGFPVYSEYFNESSGEWTNHVELGLWADLMLIAPASANTLAKLANGICDNLLAAVYLSARCPVYLAPAMDLDMFAHPATVRNIDTLRFNGNHILPSPFGELASGLHGSGRMEEPENIIELLEEDLLSKTTLKGKKALVTAGPTYENMDPVRFIGNYSSGKMGFALAEELFSKGAEVTLITGPTDLKTQVAGIKRIDVVNAAEMYDACFQYFQKSHIVVMAAAVADYTPVETSDKKIKKKSMELNIKLKKTKDILAEMGSRKSKKQVLVGFALETDNEEENAYRKLTEKNLDLIVLNSLKTPGAGFGHDTNQVSIMDPQHHRENYNLKSKKAVASDIVEKIIELIHD